MPWDDPSASGANPGQPTPEEVGEAIRLRRMHRSRLWGDLPQFDAMLDVAAKYGAFPNMDVFDDRETWVMSFNSERLNRLVFLNVRRSDALGAIIFDLTTRAFWYADPRSEDRVLWETYPEQRWFGLTGSAELQMFRESLELAFADAMHYGVEHLAVEPVSRDGSPRPTHLQLYSSSTQRSP